MHISTTIFGCSLLKKHRITWQHGQLLANLEMLVTSFRGEWGRDTGKVDTSCCSKKSVRQIVNIANQGENGEFIYNHIAVILS